jgi:hypothetical protein
MISKKVSFEKVFGRIWVSRVGCKIMQISNFPENVIL